jgi:hypothetical protein
MILASSCCLPLLPFAIGAGLAGSSTFLTEARPYLMVGSFLAIAYGFYQAWRERACRRRSSRVASVILWSSAAFVILSIFVPQLVANAIASLFTR